MTVPFKIEQTRSFETDSAGAPAPPDETLAEAIERLSSSVAPPRPAPRTVNVRQSKSPAASPSTAASSSPSTVTRRGPAAPSSGRAPARLSEKEAVDELAAVEWLARLGVDEPFFPDRQLGDEGDDPLWAEWAARMRL